MKTDALLEDLIVYCCQDLHSRSEEGVTVEELTMLYKLKIEEMKVSSELKEKEILRLNEEAFRKEQLREQRKDRYFKIAIDGASIAIPIIFYNAWMRRGFKFEETGTYTSGTFRNLFGRFRPTK